MNVHLIISGRVQGVGFRYSAQQKAKEYNLVGWVRNNMDGTVELEAEGSDDQLSAYIAELKSGFNQFICVDHIKEQSIDNNHWYKNYFYWITLSHILT